MEDLKIIYQDLSNIIGCLPNYSKAYKNQDTLILEIKETVKFMKKELGGFTSYE